MNKRYLSPNAMPPVVSYGSGPNHGKVRWIVTNGNGTTLAASEYVPTDSLPWIEEQIKAVEAEQEAAKKKPEHSPDAALWFIAGALPLEEPIGKHVREITE